MCDLTSVELIGVAAHVGRGLFGVLLLVLLLSPVDARTISFEKYECTIDIPDGATWQLMPKEEFQDSSVVLMLTNADGTMEFELMIRSAPHSFTVAGKNIEVFEKEMRSQADTIISHGNGEFAGCLTYRIEAIIGSERGPMYVTQTLLAANGYVYQFGEASIGEKDPELERITSSFRFTSTPREHKNGGAGLPSPEFVGKLVGTLLLFGMGFAVFRFMVDRVRRRYPTA